MLYVKCLKRFFIVRIDKRRYIQYPDEILCFMNTLSEKLEPNPKDFQSLNTHNNIKKSDSCGKKNRIFQLNWTKPNFLKGTGLLIIRLFISIGLIVFLLIRIDLNSLLSTIKGINLSLFMLAYLVTVVTILIKSYKWQLLLEIQDVRLSLFSIQSILYMSVFFSNFFFGSLGGDAFRIYKTKNYSKFKSGSVSSIMMDRITGLVILISIILTFGVVNLFASKPLLTWEQFLFIMVVGLGFCAAIYLGIKILLSVKQFQLFQKFPNLVKILIDFRDSIKENKTYSKHIILCLFLAFLFQMTRVISIYFLTLSAGVNTSFMQLAFVVPLVTFITMIPISLNGIGVQEGAFFLYFEKIGLDPASALLVSFLPRIMMLISSLLGAGIYMFEGIRNRYPRKSGS